MPVYLMMAYTRHAGPRALRRAPALRSRWRSRSTSRSCWMGIAFSLIPAVMWPSVGLSRRPVEAGHGLRAHDHDPEHRPVRLQHPSSAGRTTLAGHGREPLGLHAGMWMSRCWGSPASCSPGSCVAGRRGPTHTGWRRSHRHPAGLNPGLSSRGRSPPAPEGSPVIPRAVPRRRPEGSAVSAPVPRIPRRPGQTKAPRNDRAFRAKLVLGTGIPGGLPTTPGRRQVVAQGGPAFHAGRDKGGRQKGVAEGRRRSGLGAST